MNIADTLRSSLTLVSSHPLLERLFFASIEFVALAAVVYLAIRVGRIRSARLASLLWLVVLAKPIVSLAIGSPLPLIQMEVPPPSIAPEALAGTAASADESLPIGTQAAPPSGSLDELVVAPLDERRPEAITRPTTSNPTLAPVPAAQPVASHLPASSPPGHLATVILTIWLAGVTFFAGLSLLDRLRVRRLVRDARRPDPWLSARYRAIAAQLGLKRPLELRITDAIEGPALVGSVFSTILIPAWLSDDSHETKLDWALRHELMHWKLRDPLAGLVREWAQVLFYFHPVVWWAGRQWKAAVEQACDRAIVTSDADSLDYAEQLYRILVSIRGRAEVPLRTGLFATRTQIGQRIATLLNGPRTAPHLSALALVVVAAVTAVALATGGAFADRNLARDDSKETAPSESQPESPSATASRAPEADVAFTYAGTVVDERGKPVAGAEITLDYWRRIPGQRPAPPLAIADATGKFEFTRKKSDFADAGELGAWEYATLIATKTGYGLAGAESIDFETTGHLRAGLSEEERLKIERRAAKVSRDLKLAFDDVPIHGRILDVDGQPVASAVVEAITVWEGQEGSLDAWEAAGKAPRVDFSSLFRTIRQVANGFFLTGAPASVLPAVRTDAAGWFTLKGVGRDRIADLLVSGPRIETTELRARSRRGDVVKVRDVRQNRDETLFYPCEFTCVVGPSVPVEGHVTDRRSQRPLAGVLVSANQVADERSLGSIATCIRTTSGADGWYRLEGLPLGRQRIGALPPAGSRYLPVEQRLTALRIGKPLVADFRLLEGTLIRGRVTDARTGLPLSGRLEYFAFRDNPFLKEAGSFGSPSVQNFYRSDPNGAFAIPVLPGRGILAFWASRNDRFARGEGADRIKDRRWPGNSRDMTPYDTAPYGCFPQNYNLLEPIDPRPGTESVALDLTLHSGVSVKGMVLSPDGQPVTNYCMYGGRIATIWEWHEAETFEVKGCFPSDHRRLMFYHPATNRVGSYELTGTPPANLEITLQPGATITGRVVDADGQPLANLAIDDTPKSTMSTASPGRKTEGVLVNRYLRIPERRNVTDQQGRFVLPGIMPGLKYSACVFYSNQIVQRFPVTVFRDISAEPGETKDLGNLRYKPPSRADLAPLSGGAATVNAPPANVGSSDTRHAANDPKAADVVQSQSNAGQRTTVEASAASKTALVNGGNTAGGNAAAGDAIIIQGIVLGPDGKPFDGARLLWLRTRGPHARDYQNFEWVSAATSDGSGKFQLNLSRSDFNPQSPATQVAAVADGFGIDWIDVKTSVVPPQLTLRLVEDVPVHGRILDGEGRPVVGAKIGLAHLFATTSGKLDGVLNAWHSVADEAVDPMERKLRVPDAGGPFPPTQTDRDGRFEFRGLGQERLAGLMVNAPNIAQTRIGVVLRKSFDPRPLNEIVIRRWNDMQRPGKAPLLFAPEFEFVGELARIVQGTVREAGSGGPIAGALVRGNGGYGGLIWSFTDAQGRYRLEGMTILKREYQLTFDAPEGSSFLNRRQSVVSPGGSEPLTADVELIRGAVITGRVIDRQTQKPLPAVLRAIPLPQNTFANLPRFRGVELGSFVTTSATDGEFRVVTAPGQIVLTARVQVEAGKDGIPIDPYLAAQFNLRDPNHVIPMNLIGPGFAAKSGAFESLAQCHAAEILDLVEASEPSRHNLFVERGKTAVVEIQDPNGTPLTGTVVSGMTAVPPTAFRVNEARCTIYALDAGKPREILFYHPDRELAGHLEVRGDETKPLEVRLAATRTVRGRAVDATGVPLRGALVKATLGAGQAASELSKYLRLRHPQPRTDDEGNFEVKGFIPGLAVTLKLQKNRVGFEPVQMDELRRALSRAVAEPGSAVIELGEVKVSRSN